MCGIFLEVSSTKCNIVNDINITRRLKNRGPDNLQRKDLNLETGKHVVFMASVLWMQGPHMIPQPVENEYGILLYNGDIFDESWDSSISDTQIIMEKLSYKTESQTDNIISVLKSLKGPFSLIYYCKLTNKLYFTRDRLGRNSLLIHKNNNSVVLSSILGVQYESYEVPVSHINVLDLTTDNIFLYKWSENVVEENNFHEWLKMLQLKQSLSDEEFTVETNMSWEISELDDTVTFIENTAQNTNCNLTLMKALSENIKIQSTIEKIIFLLEKSVRKRLKQQPNICKNCIKIQESYCSHCSVGLLFSGGLDCTILALLADKYVPKHQSIDLLNVAFKKENTEYCDAPDRITGRQSLKELQKLCPQRKWSLKEVNVSKEEQQELQLEAVIDLIYPRQTILDESLGTALWFASRGQDEHSVSDCRVVLTGSGADELFGGYTRHRNAFKRGGWTGLSKELQLDWERIPFRNLARDNRVICDHGRQPRMPYLDEEFAEYVIHLKPWLKCFPSSNFSVGVGDKLMLRLVAFNFGLTEVSLFPKRALQFGSRIANKKEKGHDISKNFKNKMSVLRV